MLAWELDFKFIPLEIDSMIVLSWLTTKNDISPDAIPLLCDCRNLMERHIFREANGYADALAKRGNQQQTFWKSTIPVLLLYMYLLYGIWKTLGLVDCVL